MWRRFAPDAQPGADAGGNPLAALVNGYDRLFRPERLIRSERTPYQVILEHGLLRLRYYPPLAEAEIPLGAGRMAVATRRHRTPVVLVPPLAASTMIFDLLPERSLVRYLLARGFPVYLLDFGEPHRAHSHLGVRDYTMDMLPTALAKVRAHAGEPDVSLLGYCMGGLFCLIHAGVTGGGGIRNIVTIASPIDMHDSTLAARVLLALNLPTHLLRRYTDFRLHDVNPSYLQVPGWANALMFKLTSPVGSLMTYWDLLVNLADREFVAVHTTTSRWFDRMLDYPGGIVQDFFVKVGLDNALATGRIQLGDEQAEFHRIRCALLAIAGESDNLVGQASARAVMGVVASDDKSFVMAPGGHAGVFAGGKAPANTWRLAGDWLAERSD